MDRITGTNAVDIGGGKLGFRDRNLAGGITGTAVIARWLNGVQEELLGVIEEAGLTPDDENNAQLLAGLQLLFGGGGTLGPNGWQKLPGGLILQWGKGSTVTGSNGGAASGSCVITFPTPFPTTCYVTIAADESAGPGTSITIGVDIVNRFTANAHHATSAGGFFWIALGR